MKLRKSVAAAALAGAAVFVVAGCSQAEDATKSASSAITSAADKASTEATDATDKAKATVAGLDNSKAQEILRTAVNADTSDADLDKVVDNSNPVTKAALKAYATGAKAAGYGPDVYTVKDVRATDGEDNKANVTVAVKSPHAPQPVDLELTYVKVDDNWKLSGDAVTQLSSMMSQHGG